MPGHLWPSVSRVRKLQGEVLIAVLTFFGDGDVLNWDVVVILSRFKHRPDSESDLLVGHVKSKSTAIFKGKGLVNHVIHH